MNEKIQNVLNKATDYSGSNKRKIGKGVLGVIIVILLGALGLETTNNDFDLGSILNGNSVKDSKIMRDESGNLLQSENGGFVTNLMRDIEGNVVPSGTQGAKLTNEYNCADFQTQTSAQKFFTNAGGISKDTNNLDGDNDGVACEALPK